MPHLLYVREQLRTKLSSPSLSSSSSSSFITGATIIQQHHPSVQLTFVFDRNEAPHTWQTAGAASAGALRAVAPLMTSGLRRAAAAASAADSASFCFSWALMKNNECLTSRDTDVLQSPANLFFGQFFAGRFPLPLSPPLPLSLFTAAIISGAGSSSRSGAGSSSSSSSSSNFSLCRRLLQQYCVTNHASLCLLLLLLLAETRHRFIVVSACAGRSSCCSAPSPSLKLPIKP